MADKRDRSAGWLSKSTQKGTGKRLFPKKYAGEYVNLPRIDHNVASKYNMQRSKATVGPRNDSEHKLDSNFLEPVPDTKRLSTYDHDLEEWVRSERGKVVDRKNELIIHEKKTLYELYTENKGQGVFKSNWYSATRLGKAMWLLRRGNEYMFVLKTNTVEMISHIYTDYAKANRDYRVQRINWRI